MGERDRVGNFDADLGMAPVPMHMAFSELFVALHPYNDDVNIPKCLQIS